MNNLKRYTLYMINAIDIAACTAAFLLSFWIRNKLLPADMDPLQFNVYLQFLLIALISYIVFNLVYLYKDDEYLQRSAFGELMESIKVTGFVTIATLIVINFLKQNADYSRVFELIFLGIFLLLDYFGRVIMRSYLLQRYRNASFEKLILVSQSDIADRIISEIRERIDWRYSLSGIVTMDPYAERSIQDINVITDSDHMYERLEDTDYDSVLIVPNHTGQEKLQNMIHWFQERGKTVHMHIQEYEYGNSNKTLDRIGNSAVVTYRMYTPMSKRQRGIKYLFDYLLSFMALPFILVLSIIIKLLTTLEDPGSILIRRIRIGRHNTRFYQYRYRIYRLDAAERIANGKSPYTFIGRILRTTHLDGASMILNVLFGEMSIIGPKAPNLSRYLDMTAEQRNLLQIKPGIIGVWSCVKESDELQKEEQNYLEKWSFYKDPLIFLMTMLRYITGRSLRIDGDVHIREELDSCAKLLEMRTPLEYEHNYNTPQKPFYLFIKRLFDIVVSTVMLIILLIPMCIIAILIVFNDGGRPLYGHTRIGKNGRKITIYKFRSMHENAGKLENILTPEQLEKYQKEFKLDDDPRITSIGKVLRTTSLDELPQLFNILLGQISLVGPRPIVKEELEHYGKDTAKFLSVKPGLTGYWQAYARNNALYETGERQKMEMYYIDHQSLLLDLRILFRTVYAVLKKDGAE